MDKFLIWRAKNNSFTKKFGQNIRFVPFDTVATSEHTVTDIQVAPFRGCLLLRLTDYLYDPNDESVRKILNISYQKIDSAIAYQDVDGKVKIASEGYNRAYIGDEVESKNLELDWFDFASSEFMTKSINDQDENDEDSSDEVEDENDSIPEDEVDEDNVDSDDDEEETESNEEDSEKEESDDESEEEATSSIEIESEDDEKDEDANSDVQHEFHENEDMDEVESWSTNDDLHDDEEEETPRAFVETDTKEKKAPSVAANKYRLNQEPAPRYNKNKKNFKPKNNRMNNYNSSNRPNNNRRPANNNKQSSTIPLHNPVNRNSELLKRLMGL